MVCMLYMHDKGMSLHQYCLQNNLSYQTIRQYMYTLNLSMEEAIERYISRQGRHDTKCIYFYKNGTLMNFCRKHKYCYGTIRHLIVEKGMTPDQAVKHYLKFKEKQNVKRKKT